MSYLHSVSHQNSVPVGFEAEDITSHELGMSEMFEILSCIVSNSFLLLVVRHLLLVAMHLLLVAMHLFLLARLSSSFDTRSMWPLKISAPARQGLEHEHLDTIWLSNASMQFTTCALRLRKNCSVKSSRLEDVALKMSGRSSAGD